MRFLLGLTFALAATVSTAQTSNLIAEQGLTGAQAHLTALPDKSADDQFALGAVRFLRGIEKTLQLRWQHNMALKDLDMPVLRLPVAPNPEAAPFTPDLITRLFSDLRADMDSSREALALVTGDVVLDLNLLDLWFDINMNGTRDKGEGIIETGATALMTRRTQAEMAMPETMPVRFDTADVAWLTAYTHLISGVSELVVAFDPTEAITQVLSSSQQMNELRGQPFERIGYLGAGEARWVDQFAMVYGALNQQPVAENTRAAHAHFLEMIAQNKLFWAGVAAETDNVSEWIPNGNQTAALGFTLPPETAETWQALLSDAEGLLNGELLVSYWRIAPSGGVNVKKLFMDPPVVDIVTWIQGAGLLDYLERGPVVSRTNLRNFERMVSGDTLLYSLLFN